MDNRIVCAWRVVRAVARATNPRPAVLGTVRAVRRYRPRARMALVCSVVGGPVLLAPGLPAPGHLYRPSAPVSVELDRMPPGITTTRERNPTPVPAPGALALLGGFAMFAWAVYRGRK